MRSRYRLTEQQADDVERELRRLEDDPAVSKRELRLFLQWPMPCGHPAASLLTCDTPPFGCLQCNAVDFGAQSRPEAKHQDPYDPEGADNPAQFEGGP